jgi:hypothetical protein
MSLSIKEIGALAPIGFFHLTFEIFKEWTELPHVGALLGEPSLLKVKIAYYDNGLRFAIIGKTPFVEGDRFHLFIDTRDVKDRGVPHRYCHHFLISIEGGEEVTRFRGDEVRKIAEPFPVIFKGKQIEIELNDLYGFHPGECPRLGFAYFFELESGQKQHFAVSSKEYNIAQHPDLWASGVLV